MWSLLIAAWTAGQGQALQMSYPADAGVAGFADHRAHLVRRLFLLNEFRVLLQEILHVIVR